MPSRAFFRYRPQNWKICRVRSRMRESSLVDRDRSARRDEREVGRGDVELVSEEVALGEQDLGEVHALELRVEKVAVVRHNELVRRVGRRVD